MQWLANGLDDSGPLVGGSGVKIASSGIDRGRLRITHKFVSSMYVHQNTLLRLLTSGSEEGESRLTA